MEWLLLCGLSYLTARRLAFENGAYAQALAEAEELRVVADCDLDDPSPGPGAERLHKVRSRRHEVNEAEAPPRSLPATHRYRNMERRGSAAERVQLRAA